LPWRGALRADADAGALDLSQFGAAPANMPSYNAIFVGSSQFPTDVLRTQRRQSQNTVMLPSTEAVPRPWSPYKSRLPRAGQAGRAGSVAQSQSPAGRQRGAHPRAACPGARAREMPDQTGANAACICAFKGPAHALYALCPPKTAWRASWRVKSALHIFACPERLHALLVPAYDMSSVSRRGLPAGPLDAGAWQVVGV
jgi:hypothetical protein